MVTEDQLGRWPKPKSNHPTPSTLPPWCSAQKRLPWLWKETLLCSHNEMSPKEMITQITCTFGLFFLVIKLLPSLPGITSEIITGRGREGLTNRLSERFYKGKKAEKEKKLSWKISTNLFFGFLFCFLLGIITIIVVVVVILVLVPGTFTLSCIPNSLYLFNSFWGLKLLNFLLHFSRVLELLVFATMLSCC